MSRALEGRSSRRRGERHIRVITEAPSLLDAASRLAADRDLAATARAGARRRARGLRVGALRRRLHVERGVKARTGHVHAVRVDLARAIVGGNVRPRRQERVALWWHRRPSRPLRRDRIRRLATAHARSGHEGRRVPRWAGAHRRRGLCARQARAALLARVAQAVRTKRTRRGLVLGVAPRHALLHGRRARRGCSLRLACVVSGRCVRRARSRRRYLRQRRGRARARGARHDRGRKKAEEEGEAHSTWIVLGSFRVGGLALSSSGGMRQSA
jgi:hypothetical protein